MTSQLIQPETVRVALDRVSGSAFEDFFKLLFAELTGVEFVPLGGMHDGGADALADESIYQGESSGAFYQASTQANSKPKIRQTVNRLEASGRAPTRLTYVTSRLIQEKDTLEDQLTTALDVSIRIRDAEYIAAHVNHSATTRGAFQKLVAPALEPIRTSDSLAHKADRSPHVAHPAVYVFLRHELDDPKRQDATLIDAVTDSLILWALEGTDPNEGVFRTPAEIRDAIYAELPQAQQVIDARIDTRLYMLSSKHLAGKRQIKHHQQANQYCLPFETRQSLEDENIVDQSLRVTVKDILIGRLIDADSDLSEKVNVAALADASLRAIDLVFERQGLELTAFIADTEDGGGDPPFVSDAVNDALHEAGWSSELDAARNAIVNALRSSLYHGDDTEREFYAKCARTHVLLFALRKEPRVVSYLEEMAGDFRLIVGSDILISALSERYLPEENRPIQKLLEMTGEAGATLFLAEPALEEVVSHIRSTDVEYKEHFQGADDAVSFEIAQNIPKVLLRAYFYARMERSTHVAPPASWEQYVEQVLSYRSLHRRQGEEELRDYLLGAFGLEYLTREEMEGVADPEDVSTLSSALEERKDPRLALNDALMACAVYGLRNEAGESKVANEMGYRTWWLTEERVILRYAQDLLSKHHGARFIMRPAFILHFLSLAPSAEDVRRAYRDVFPSALGLRLARRIDAGAMHKFMGRVREAMEFEPARRQAAIRRLSDELKSEMNKEYATDVGERVAPDAP